MFSDDIHVCVCVPSTGQWHSEFGKSLAIAFSYFAQHRVGNCHSQRLSLLTVTGSMLPFERHELLKTSIRAGSTHTLFLDSDMSFPPDTINRLVGRDLPVVAANCTTRAKPVVTTTAGLDGRKVISAGKTGVEQVLHTGLAVFLFRTELAKRLTPPIFMQAWIDHLGAHCGEDVYFCHKLQEEAGAAIFIDHELSVEIKHHGHYAYGHDDVCSELQAIVDSADNLGNGMQERASEDAK